MEIKHCKRCNEDWCFRGTGRPIRCGKCKSPYWDKDRKQGQAGPVAKPGEQRIRKPERACSLPEMPIKQGHE